MFTGIVEELGEVVGIDAGPQSARITIRGPVVTGDATRGASIAVNGVCLTVAGRGEATFTADVMPETLRRTALAGLVPGAPVNLERPMRADGRFGGHIVQGHVDGTGTVVDRVPGDGWDVVRIAVPGDLARYVVEKGSVAVDGVSLTVVAVDDTPLDAAGEAPVPGHAPVGGRERTTTFTVSLIPETLLRTTLGRREPGDEVNLEVDVLAKYVERMLVTGTPAGGGR
jgi:riboflavin synthase